MHHILITGTGRSGTTLLVEVLTALGFDTGYTLDTLAASIDPVARAGLEPDFRNCRLHHVVKLPGRARELRELLSQGRIELEAAIVPIRDLHAAAESRRNVYRKARSLVRNALKHPGSLWGTKDPTQQEAALALEFYNCVEVLVSTGAPMFFLEFPRFARDASYLYQTLRPIFGKLDISEAAVAQALATVCREDLINTFQPSAEAECGPRKLDLLASLAFAGI